MNQLTIALAPLRKFFEKHHVVLYISFIAILLIVCIYLLYSAAVQTPIDDSATTNAMSQFDQETTEKIKKLHDSSDTSQALSFPTGRINPFVE